MKFFSRKLTKHCRKNAKGETILAGQLTLPGVILDSWADVKIVELQWDGSTLVIMPEATREPNMNALELSEVLPNDRLEKKAKPDMSGVRLPDYIQKGDAFTVDLDKICQCPTCQRIHRGINETIHIHDDLLDDDEVN
jgi:hypothetical protein